MAVFKRLGSREEDYYNHEASVLWRDNGGAGGDVAGASASGPPGNVCNPVGLCFSWNGDLFVAQAGRKCVTAFAKSGEVQSSIGKNLGISPKDVAVSKNDEVFVVNTQDKQNDVVVFSTEGHRLDRWGQGYFVYPRGVCLNRDGHVLVSDKAQGRVSEHEQDGRLIAEVCASKTSSSKLKSPTFLHCDSHGRVIVTDREKNHVKVFSPQGKFLFKLDPKTHRPKTDQKVQECIVQGVTVDDKHHIYVALYSDHVIQEFSPSGKFVENFLSGEVTWPVGLATDPSSGCLAVSESNVPKSHSCIKCFTVTK